MIDTSLASAAKRSINPESMESPRLRLENAVRTSAAKFACIGVAALLLPCEGVQRLSSVLTAYTGANNRYEYQDLTTMKERTPMDPVWGQKRRRERPTMSCVPQLNIAAQSPAASSCPRFCSTSSGATGTGSAAGLPSSAATAAGSTARATGPAAARPAQ
jgi:hypothetical protein